MYSLIKTFQWLPILLKTKAEVLNGLWGTTQTAPSMTLTFPPPTFFFAYSAQATEASLSQPTKCSSSSGLLNFLFHLPETLFTQLSSSLTPSFYSDPSLERASWSSFLK